MGREGRFNRGRTGQKGRTPALVKLYWLQGAKGKRQPFCRGTTGLHRYAVVLGRMDWAEALKTRFSAF